MRPLKHFSIRGAGSQVDQIHKVVIRQSCKFLSRFSDFPFAVGDTQTAMWFGAANGNELRINRNELLSLSWKKSVKLKKVEATWKSVVAPWFEICAQIFKASQIFELNVIAKETEGWKTVPSIFRCWSLPFTKKNCEITKQKKLLTSLYKNLFSIFHRLTADRQA